MQIEFEDIPNLTLDKKYILGADEVGTGSCAGSIIVCGVKSLKDWSLSGLNDSKKLSAKKRYSLRELLKKEPISFHIAERTNLDIDKDGLSKCLHDCYLEIYEKLYDEETFCVVDGNLKFKNNIHSLIKADGLVTQVMAASILAKTTRDDMMKEQSLVYPQYGWDKNVGYSTASHLKAIKDHGQSPIHRKSYKLKILNS